MLCKKGIKNSTVHGLVIGVQVGKHRYGRKGNSAQMKCSGRRCFEHVFGTESFFDPSALPDRLKSTWNKL